MVFIAAAMLFARRDRVFTHWDTSQKPRPKSGLRPRSRDSGGGGANRGSGPNLQRQEHVGSDWEGRRAARDARRRQTRL